MTTSSAADDKSHVPDITEDDINNAQREWCRRLVAVSRAYRDPREGDYRQLAADLIDDLYDFQHQTFFRPTLATAPYNFRTTRAGALSYFIGGNPDYDDKGFALEKWESAWHDNDIDDTKAIQRHRDIGIAMGHVRFSDAEVNGTVTTVDKTFVFKKYRDGSVRLVVHMSALTRT